MSGDHLGLSAAVEAGRAREENRGTVRPTVAVAQIRRGEVTDASVPGVAGVKVISAGGAEYVVAGVSTRGATVEVGDKVAVVFEPGVRVPYLVTGGGSGGTAVEVRETIRFFAEE